VLDSDGYVTAVKFEYSKTAEQVQADNEAVEQAAESIISGLDDSMSDYDKVKAIHDAVIKGCTYDESDSECYTALGCLEKGKAVCEGYAKAMMLLCGKVGIGCIPVVGSGIEDGNELPHIWNKVLIDGEWYNFDLTWDDPVSSLGDDYVRYDYFAVTDEEIGTDHITEENKYVTYPVADTDGGDYFSVNGLYITDISEAEAVVRSSVERAMADDEIYARFKCADSETYNAVVDEIFNNEYDGGTKIFGILREACERYSEKSYSSTGYSIIKNEQMNTVTVKLNRL
jgi:transglutaminase/protease-like cytokinesis protein 3